MIVIITSPVMTRKSFGGSEAFCFNNDRLRIVFKGEHHVSVSEKGTGMVVKLADVSAIVKLLVSQGIPFSTEHVTPKKGTEYVTPQILMTTEFVTNQHTGSLEQEVDMLINVIANNRSVGDLVNHISNMTLLSYRQQMQPYFQHPGMVYPNYQQPHNPNMNPGWNRE